MILVKYTETKSTKTDGRNKSPQKAPAEFVKTGPQTDICRL